MQEIINTIGTYMFAPFELNNDKLLYSIAGFVYVDIPSMERNFVNLRPRIFKVIVYSLELKNIVKKMK